MGLLPSAPRQPIQQVAGDLLDLDPPLLGGEQIVGEPESHDREELRRRMESVDQRAPEP